MLILNCFDSHPEEAWLSTSGHDCLRLQNTCRWPGCWLCCLRKDPALRIGGPVPGGRAKLACCWWESASVRRLADNVLCSGDTVPGAGTTLGKPWGAGGGASVAAPLPAVVGADPVESVLLPSRERLNRFGLRVKFATLLVTICCNELKKLMVSKS